MIGSNISDSIVFISNLKKIPKEIKFSDGSIDLEKIIGDRETTQEMKALKHVALSLMFSPYEDIRKASFDALDLCTFSLIHDIYVEKNKIYLDINGKQAYLCEVPDKHKNSATFPYK